MLSTREHVHTKNSKFDKPNFTRKLSRRLFISKSLPQNKIVNNNKDPPAQAFKWKVLEVFYIRKFKPTLNNQNYYIKIITFSETELRVYRIPLVSIPGAYLISKF